MKTPTEEDLRYVAMEYLRLRKLKWERRLFRPTPNPPAAQENPIESAPAVNNQLLAEPRQQNKNHPAMKGVKCYEPGQI